MKNILHFIASLLFIGVQASSAEGELQLILAPRGTTVTAEGYIQFDLYVYNGGDRPLEIPAPEAEFNVHWILRDTDNVRQDRDGSHFVLGTDTVKRYVLKPQTAIKRDLGDRLLAEPGDLLEFYISVERKLKSGGVENIRSNSVVLYRPKEREAQR